MFAANTGYGYGDTGSHRVLRAPAGRVREPARDAGLDGGPGADVRQAAVLLDARRRGRLRRQGAAGGDVLRAADVSRLPDRRPRRARASAGRPERIDDRLARERRPPSVVQPGHDRSRALLDRRRPRPDRQPLPADPAAHGPRRDPGRRRGRARRAHHRARVDQGDGRQPGALAADRRPRRARAGGRPRERGLPGDAAARAGLRRPRRPSYAPEPRRRPVRRRPGRSGGTRDPAAVHADRRRRAALALDGLRPAADHARRYRRRRWQGDVRRHDARQRRDERGRAVRGRRGRVAPPGPDDLGRARTRLRAAPGGRRSGRRRVRPARRRGRQRRRRDRQGQRPRPRAARGGRRRRAPLVADPPPGPDGMSQPPVTV